MTSRATPVHGVLMRVAGMGVLIRGAAGSGKSTLALGLLDRGHQLIADDAPLVHFDAASQSVVGTCPEPLHGLLCIRGMPGAGLLDVAAQFGAGACAAQSTIGLLCDLPCHLPSHPSGDLPGDRLGDPLPSSRGSDAGGDTLDSMPASLCGHAMPRVQLPAAPLIDAALWVETAARAVQSPDPIAALDARHARAVQAAQAAQAARAVPCS